MAWMLSNVLRNFAGGPATRRYPYEVRSPFLSTRGQLVIEKEKCVYCTACARKCPASALKVDRAAKSFLFDPQKCVFCGACCEVCPKDCLNMSELHRTPHTGGRQYFAFYGDDKSPEPAAATPKAE